MNVIGNICSTWVGNEYIQQTFVNNKIVAFNSIGIWKMFPGGIELSPMHHTGKELNHSATRTLSRLLRHIRKDVTGALCAREKMLQAQKREASFRGITLNFALAPLLSTMTTATATRP